jgi:hypothetical protein
MVELVLDLAGCRREGGWSRAKDLDFVAGSFRHRRKARAELESRFPIFNPSSPDPGITLNSPHGCITENY